jgi:hypothetical protein
MVGRHSGRPVWGVGWVVPPKAGSPTVRAAAWRAVRRFRMVVGQPARGARAERPTLRLAVPCDPSCSATKSDCQRCGKKIPCDYSN